VAWWQGGGRARFVLETPNKVVGEAWQPGLRCSPVHCLQVDAVNAVHSHMVTAAQLGTASATLSHYWCGRLGM